MKTQYVVIEGLGGQGVLSAGRFLGYVAVRTGLSATFSPFYGAEVRGGLSRCDVVISEEPVRSFLVEDPTTLLLFCQQAWESRKGDLSEEAEVLVNSSLVDTGGGADPARIHALPASRIAEQIGSPKVVNSVMVGAYAALSRVLPVEAFVDRLEEILPRRYAHTIPANAEALRRGFAAIAS